jgi:cytochrome c-type biogenesis protein
MQHLPGEEGSMSFDVILTSFSLGLLATTSPCVLPLYPGYLAYLSGGSTSGEGRQRYLLGAFVLAGVLTMMLFLGFLIALLSVSVGSALSIAIPFADLTLVILGILLLLNINPFKRLPQLRIPVLSHPFMNAYVYGLLYGPIALPCSGPLVVSIFALSLNAEQFLSTLSTFLWFGLGFGMPLLLLSLLSGAAQRWITRLFAQHARAVNVIGGLLLVGLGAYDLVANWDLLLAYWV